MSNKGYATVIHCEGPAGEVYVNGIIQKEIHKINERYNREIATLSDELKVSKDNNNRLFKEKLNVLQALERKRKRIVYVICNKVSTTWGVIWYLGVMAKLWKDNHA